MGILSGDAAAVSTETVVRATDTLFGGTCMG
jgi:hypothetical protein